MSANNRGGRIQYSNIVIVVTLNYIKSERRRKANEQKRKLKAINEGLVKIHEEVQRKAAHAQPNQMLWLNAGKSTLPRRIEPKR